MSPSKTLRFFILLNIVGKISPFQNAALYKPTFQGPDTLKLSQQYYKYNDSTIFQSGKAVDGLVGTHFSQCTHTVQDADYFWWMVDLQDVYIIRRVELLNRNEVNDRLQDFTVDVFLRDPRPDPGFPGKLGDICAHQLDAFGPSEWAELKCDRPITGRFVRVIKNAYAALTLCEGLMDMYARINGERGGLGVEHRLPTQKVRVFASKFFGRTFQRTPNRQWHTAESQHHLGEFVSAIHCATFMLQQAQLTAFRYNEQSGRCMGFEQPYSGWDASGDDAWDLYLESY
ncbi:hypothetical protein EGW08_021031 [Elysia chlorotica]|uniref:Fucolectin tachylectin-4 pentraxin-1 domain-containing protein n=1 Tax=Elysia chlorotica TaxID=188477 RepID=A0A433SPQ5_ELYCH|nr:hypothetical protein EGW08_021031 [Elysia chlorotica]